MNLSDNRALHAYAVFTACCTLLLVVAGALVTSNDAGLSVPDWPLSYGSLMPPMTGGIFYEHGHRMVATTVGLLTIGLAVWLQRRERRPWMRKLGWTALALVIAQGVLGGLTVLFYLPRPVSIAHASLAQLFFCTTVGLALFTSRWWQSDRPEWNDAAPVRLRNLAVATAAVIFVQLILGAAFRHRLISVLPHVFWAGVVVCLTVWAGIVVKGRLGHVQEVRRLGILLPSLAVAQVLLGAGSYWFRVVDPAPQPLLPLVFFSVAHVAVGAITLAASVLLALCCFRLATQGAHVGAPLHTAEAGHAAMARLGESAS